MSVSPVQIVPDIATKADKRTKAWLAPYLQSQRMQCVLTFAYILWSMFANIYYLKLLYPSFSNDMWWAGYNITGYEAYLIDVINQNLVAIQANEDLDILKPSMAIHKTYSSSESSTNIYPTYVRRLSLLKLTTLEFVITNLRSMKLDKVLWLPTSLCWVDFNQAFELGHTEARQKRCKQLYAANGAVYFESVLRNTDFNTFTATYSGPGNLFTTGFQEALELSADGTKWLHDISIAFNQNTIATEVSYWKSYNITYFQMQWTNDRDPSIAESISVKNALGMTLTIALKNIPSRIGPWTSIALTQYLADDLTYARSKNSSLIRSAPNFVSKSVSFEDELGLFNSQGVYENQTSLFRNRIGPFLAVDAIYIQVPPELNAFNKWLQELVFNQEILPEHIAAKLSSLPPLVISPTPPSWNNTKHLYYGGSPICMFKRATTYVQSMLSFDDTCNNQTPFVMSIRLIAIFFATALSPPFSIADICALGTTLVPECTSYLSFAVQTLTTNNKTMYSTQKVLSAVEPLNISLFQFATNLDSSNWTILLHPILDKTSAFTFFGYVMLYEWLIGAREVISLQGDVSTIVLISEAYDAVPYATSGGSHYIKSATEVVYYVTAYAGLVLAIVAILSLGIGVFDRQLNSNLFYFNRVAGSTWVGRSLLFLRGMSALLIISTANIELISIGNAWSRFELNQRHWFDMAILAGESTWMTYVINELLILFFPHLTFLYAPWSAMLTWFLLLIIQATAPIGVVAFIETSCQAGSFSVDLHCMSGTIEIGQTSRLVLHSCLLIGVVIVCVMVAAFKQDKHKPSDQDICFVSGVATTFINWEQSAKWKIDRIAYFMCGLVPFQFSKNEYVFDLNLWVITETSSTQCRLRLDTRQLTNASLSNVNHSTTSESSGSVSCLHRWLEFGRKLVCLIYLGLATVGSLSYLDVSQVNIANDLAWATFNSSGIHAYIATYFNQALFAGNIPNSLDLADASINIVEPFGMSTTNLHVAGNAGTRYQLDRITSLVQTIQGLRNMDACDTPFIFSPYCYLDFNATWSIAHSSARAVRCRNMTSNGAMFLESVLRNIDASAWQTCWGTAFNIAFGSVIASSNSGARWLAATFAKDKPSMTAEAAYWNASGITTFSTQWQNFKFIGVINTYRIKNAWGITYPFTLINTNGKYRFESQTSYKMYWGLANDLLWVSSNLTNSDSRSLVRGSSNYAFKNVSYEEVLIKNGTVPWPVGPGFAAVRTSFGPFGTIDTRLVAVPNQLHDIVARMHTQLHSILRTDKHARTVYNNMTIHYDAFAVPKPWMDLDFLTFGGSPLCEAVPLGAGVAIKYSLSTLFSFDYGCYSTQYTTPLLLGPENAIFAYMMSSSTLDADATCNLDPSNFGVCMKAINSAQSFVETFLNANTIDLAPVYATVKQLDIHLLQIGKLTANETLMDLYSINLLDDPTFWFYAWVFLHHWVNGDHTVVTFQGDNGTLTLISEYIYPSLQDVQSYEVPITLASYARSCNTYITYAMIGVTLIVLVYFILCHGHVEGRNLMKLNRVGALNWIGRPLIFVRSLTAIALLSTGAMELSYDNGVSYLTQTSDPWYTIVLASSEVTWLVEVVNDIALAVTQAYTPYYATINTWFVWAVTGLLSAFYPVTPVTKVNPSCQVIEVDFQLLCETAVISIGQEERLMTLIVIVLSCNLLMYLTTRLLIKKKPIAKVDSLFLAAGAKYLFSHDRWIDKNIYYLDQASAMLNGLLTIRTKYSFIVLDIKFWRVFHIPALEPNELPKESPLSKAAMYAIPLVMMQNIHEA